MKILFYGNVRNGKLSIDSPHHFKQYLLGLNGAIQFSIEKKRRKITASEHRYYRGVIVPMVAAEIGEENEVAHNLLKSLWLKKIIFKEICGKVERFEFIPSTADLSTFEAEQFYENCRRWAAEFLKINIPSPNEQSFTIDGEMDTI